jgi:hypothetical protein
MMDVHAGFKQDRSRQQAGYEAEGREEQGVGNALLTLLKHWHL